MNYCNENSYYFDIANVQCHIKKDGKYWYVANTYDNCINYLYQYCDPTRGFRTQDNALAYLKKGLVKYAKQILKELS